MINKKILSAVICLAFSLGMVSSVLSQPEFVPYGFQNDVVFSILSVVSPPDLTLYNVTNEISRLDVYKMSGWMGGYSSSPASPCSNGACSMFDNSSSSGQSISEWNMQYDARYYFTSYFNQNGVTSMNIYVTAFGGVGSSGHAGELALQIKNADGTWWTSSYQEIYPAQPVSSKNILTFGVPQSELTGKSKLDFTFAVRDSDVNQTIWVYMSNMSFQTSSIPIASTSTTSIQTQTQTTTSSITIPILIIPVQHPSEWWQEIENFVCMIRSYINWSC